MARTTATGFFKANDKSRALVIRVPAKVADDFAALMADRRRGARSEAFVALIVAELARHGLQLDDPRFDEPKRRDLSRFHRRTDPEDEEGEM